MRIFNLEKAKLTPDERTKLTPEEKAKLAADEASGKYDVKLTTEKANETCRRTYLLCRVKAIAAFMLRHSSTLPFTKERSTEFPVDEYKSYEEFALVWEFYDSGFLSDFELRSYQDLRMDVKKNRDNAVQLYPEREYGGLKEAEKMFRRISTLYDTPVTPASKQKKKSETKAAEELQERLDQGGREALKEKKKPSRVTHYLEGRRVIYQMFSTSELFYTLFDMIQAAATVTSSVVEGFRESDGVRIMLTHADGELDPFNRMDAKKQGAKYTAKEKR